MRKLLILILLCVLLVGCSSKDREEEINNIVLNSSYSVIMEKLNDNVSNITMFPTKELEEDFVYYIKSIINNLSKFNQDEVRNIYNKININYSFQFNKINYDINDYRDDLNKIEKYMNE